MWVTVAALAAGVTELDPRDAAEHLDGVGDALVPLDLVVVPDAGAGGRRASVGGDGDLLGEHQSESAGGPGAEVADVEVVHLPVG